MANLQHHIERLREQPHHVRHGIAYGVSGGITALVVVVWATVLMTSGALEIKPAVVASSGSETGSNPDTEVKKALADSKSAFSNLMGAAGAAGAAVGATSTDAALTIITARASSTMDSKIDNSTSKTVIPF